MRRILAPKYRVNHAYSGPPVAAPLLIGAKLQAFDATIQAQIAAAPPITDKDAAPAVISTTDGVQISMGFMQSWAQKQFRASNIYGLLDTLALLLHSDESFKVPAKRYGFVCLVEDSNSSAPYMQQIRRLWAAFKADSSDANLRIAVKLAIFAMSQTRYTRVNAHAQRLAFDEMAALPQKAFMGSEDELVKRMMQHLRDKDAHGATVLLQVLRMRYNKGTQPPFVLNTSKEIKAGGHGCVSNGCPLSVWAALEKNFPAFKKAIAAYNYMANNSNTTWTLFLIDLFRAITDGEEGALKQIEFKWDSDVVAAAIAYVRLRAENLEGTTIPKRVFDKHQGVVVGDQQTMEFFINVASSMAREWQDKTALDIVARGKASYLACGKSTRSQVAVVVSRLQSVDPRPKKRVRLALQPSPTVLYGVEAPIPLPASLPCGTKPPTVIRKEPDGSYVAVKGPLATRPVVQLGFDALKSKFGLPSVGMTWDEASTSLVSPLMVAKGDEPPLRMHPTRDGFIMMHDDAWGIPLLQGHLKRGHTLSDAMALQLMQHLALRRVFGITDTHTRNFVLHKASGTILSIDEMAQSNGKFGGTLMTLLCTKAHCAVELSDSFVQNLRALTDWVKGPMRSILKTTEGEWSAWNTLGDKTINLRMETLLTSLLAIVYKRVGALESIV